MTLVELMVSLTIVAVMYAIVMVPLGTAGARNSQASGTSSHRKAVLTGRQIRENTAGVARVFLPDGRMLGPGYDPLIGAPIHAK
jgi:type II secretory pathway pseudopilin PulG